MSRSAIALKLLPILLVGTLVAGAVAWDWYSAVPPSAMNGAKFVGRATCAECHQTEHSLWLGSHHDRAMEIATEQTVLGDFNDATFTRLGVTTRFFRRDGKFFVNTEGRDGKYHDFEVKYTFGVDPLQQYMVELERGRVQVLRVSWDTNQKQWFEVTPPDVPDERLEPGDPLHWTGIAQNWNTTCADCHSTDVHKNYNPDTDTYLTSYEEIDVSCEECHGPGSVHVGLAQSSSLFWDRNVGYGLARLKGIDTTPQLETCAKCHSRRHQIHEEFRPGKPLLDFYEPSLLAAGLYHADGQIQDEVYEYGSFLQSKMHANHVRCSDCHDPHSLKLKFTGNKLCAQCHEPGKYDTPAHHHHQPGSTWAQCIECHMPARLYMVVDSRRDHSFRIPRPDLSVELGTPNACNDCHTKPEESAEWAAEAVRKWYGEKRRDDPHWAPAIAAGRANKPEAESLLIDVIRRKTTPAIVRATAVSLLNAYPTNESTKTRRDSLNDADALVRATAVRSLSGYDPQLLVSDLATRLSDPIRNVRIAAASRLAFMPINHLSSSYSEPFRKAFAEFVKSQELSLDHAGGHLTLAALDRRGGDIDEAMTHLRTAIKLEPYLAGPRTELASLLEERGNATAEILRLREEEVELLKRDTTLAPDNPGIYFELGRINYLLGRLDEANAAFLEACRLAPRSYDYRLMLALLEERRYDVTGDKEFLMAATASLRKLEVIQPGDPRTAGIAQRLLATRRAKDAASD